MGCEWVRLAEVCDWQSITTEFRPMYRPGNDLPTRLLAGI